MKTLTLVCLLIFIATTFYCKAITVLIIDSVEIKKVITANKINNEIIKNEKYVPINNIDKIFIKNLLFYNMVLNISKRVEYEIEEEKRKEFIIIDTPPVKRNAREFNDYFPII